MTTKKMTATEARVWAAELIGWRREAMRKIKPLFYWVSPEGKSDIIVSGDPPCPFSPETDANDDYAILKWAQNNMSIEKGKVSGASQWDGYCWELEDSKYNYDLGDYFRALLAAHGVEVVDDCA